MRTRAPRPLRVLEVVRPPDGTTRYIDQVISFAGDTVDFSYISLRTALFAGYDVVHFHWPEMLVRHRLKVAEFVKCLLLDGWIRRLHRRRVGIVRTLHNVAPHEGARPRVARSLAQLDEATDLFVTINPVTAVPDGGRYIPHGHYRDRFRSHPRHDMRPGRVLYAGLIRPYKGVEELLAAFGRIEDASTTLRIVGKPTPQLYRTVTDAVAANPRRISARLEFVADDAFVEEITSAEVVCLPYRELHNSGILLVALSLDRPVLVPDTPATRALAEEVGPGWVTMFPGRLDATHLAAALTAARTQVRSARPTLTDRDWTRVGHLYSEAFRAAKDRARTR